MNYLPVIGFIIIILLSILSLPFIDYSNHKNNRKINQKWGYADFETFKLYFDKQDWIIGGHKILSYQMQNVVTEYKFMFNNRIMIMNNIKDYCKARKYMLQYIKDKQNQQIKW